MALIEVVLCTACLVLAAVALYLSLSLGRQIEGFSRQLRKDTSSLLELRYREGAYKRLKSAQQTTESALGTGTLTIHGVHMGVAEIPFGVLGKIPGISKTTTIIREAHNQISDIVYGTILGVNKVAGEATRRTIDQRAGPRTSETSPETKK